MSSSRKTILNILEGLTPYQDALHIQKETVSKRKEGTVGDTLILVEHTPVITLGKNAPPNGVLATEEDLNRRGFSVHRIERGGQATYHGPGQIVGYPIIDLHEQKMGVAQYVSKLEDVMIIAARNHGIAAARRDGMTGVFATSGSQGKIGALGVRVSRGITFHGFAFNVIPNLSHYQLIVPCGMIDTPVTSIGDLLETKPSMEFARRTIVDAYGQVFQTTFI